MERKISNSPWSWVPTLYFAEGLPYFAVNTISVLMFKRLGMSNADVAFYTGWLYLPWVIKPFWSPFVDIIKTKRWWVVAMQIIMALGIAAVGLTIPVQMPPEGSLFLICLLMFWIVGFASATHDIAADGYYMIALNSSQQSLFVGIRSTFYRLASIFGQGVLVVIAGILETKGGNIPLAWRTTFIGLSILFAAIAIYHAFVMPRPSSDRNVLEGRNSSAVKEFFSTFGSFFKKPHIVIAVLFIMFFRLPEAQLVKMITPFLVDPVETGGLGLNTTSVGVIYGTFGVIGLTVGGILGGICASQGGLKKWLWPMVLALTIPDLVYCYMSMVQPSNIILINICVILEQFGYGFGFTAFTLFMMYFVDGEHKTSHYAICTGIMALGMMVPGMLAGWVQERLGYVGFFWYVAACCIVSWVLAALIKIDPEYGKRKMTKA